MDVWIFSESPLVVENRVGFPHPPKSEVPAGSKKNIIYQPFDPNWYLIVFMVFLTQKSHICLVFNGIFLFQTCPENSLGEQMREYYHIRHPRATFLR